MAVARAPPCTPGKLSCDRVVEVEMQHFAEFAFHVICEIFGHEVRDIRGHHEMDGSHVMADDEFLDFLRNFFCEDVQASRCF